QSDAVFSKQFADRISSAYYRARWEIGDGTTEARRLTYATLNKLNMHHPLQRIGDLLYGTHVPTETAQPKLTPENNPISAFERSLPQYVRDIQLKEQQLAGTAASDYEKRRAIHDEIGDISKKFAVDLLAVWHGTAQRPGIVSHSDDELAMANTSPQRVARIRKALTLTARSEYADCSPLTRALTQLLPETMRSAVGQNHEIAHDLAAAKAEFFG